MSSKKEKNVIVLDADKIDKLVDLANESQDQIQKDIEIKNAKISDLVLHYGYEMLTRKSKGDVIPSRKGTNEIHDDLRDAFGDLDVFIAHIDGAFKTWSNNQTPLTKLEESGELELYKVSCFKIVGQEENRSLILVGHKDTDFGVINFETPKIKLEKSTYLYIEEMNQRLNNVVNEVEKYMNGKFAPKPEQMFMDFAEEDDATFEKAKLE
jgi:hypothetical protein